MLITTSSSHCKRCNTQLVFLILKLSRNRCCAPVKFLQLLLDHWQPDYLIWSPLTVKRKMSVQNCTPKSNQRQKMEAARESDNVLAKLATGDGRLFPCSMSGLKRACLWNSWFTQRPRSSTTQNLSLGLFVLVYTFKSELLIQTDSNEFPAYLGASLVLTN